MENMMKNETAGFTPTVEVTRESSMVGALFSFKVYVDGNLVGKVGNGEKKRFQLPAGLHEIQIKQMWWGSPKESFLLKDFTKFQCKPKIGIFGVIFGKIAYYMLFKRKKFIVLNEN